MIFKKLHIKNFQSHVNTIIDFQNGLNIIVGPSDTGKSAIIRALRKLVRDDPLGKDFINKNATECTIELIIEKNNVDYKIIREVTASKNLYYLNDHEFGGFGREIPQEIQNTLEMALIELENSDKIDLHFVDQHDAPFMVARGSAGTRSKLLGRIGGLHILDRAISFINKDIRAGNNTLKEKINTKNELQQKIKMLPDLIGPESVLMRLTKDFKELRNQQQLLEVLEREYVTLNDITVQGKHLKNVLTRLPSFQIDFNKIWQQVYKLKELESLSIQLHNINMRVNQLISKIPSEITVDFDCIKKQQQQLQELENLRNQYDDVNDKIISTTQAREMNITTLVQLRKEWVDILHTLKICPTCKQSTAHIGDCDVTK